MAYYVRILGTSDPDIHLDDLSGYLSVTGMKAKFAIDQNEKPANWTYLEVANEKGDTLAQIERNPVEEGELGWEELKEFQEEVLDCVPVKAAAWLSDFFDRVKVIYAFQLLDATLNDNNYEIINNIRTTIWNKTKGILQSDGEGFTNEEGFHILWQFSDDVSGEWHCAVLSDKGEWERFSMDLGDAEQRKEFIAGKMPGKATRVNL